MARPTSPTLTEAELRIMEVLWERGPSTVAEVIAAIYRQVSLAYTTVLTTLRILERKGHVRHERRGKAYVYHPVLDREGARRESLRFIVSRFFDGSPELAVRGLVRHEGLTADALAALAEEARKREPPPE